MEHWKSKSKVLQILYEVEITLRKKKRNMVCQKLPHKPSNTTANEQLFTFSSMANCHGFPVQLTVMVRISLVIPSVEKCLFKTKKRCEKCVCHIIIKDKILYNPSTFTSIVKLVLKI